MPPVDDSRSDWRLVLAPRSQRKVVLFNRSQNALIVSSPNQSTSTTTTLGDSRAGSLGCHRPRLASEEVQVEPLDSDEDSPPPPSTTSSRTSTPTTRSPLNLCPLCYSPLHTTNRKPPTPRQRTLPLSSPISLDHEAVENTQILTRVPTYFQLLSEANSLANTPTTTGQARDVKGTESSKPITEPPLNHSQFNEGYFSKFFEEVQLLGRGGQGAVYLVRHVLNGEGLGLYACKKIAVGDSTLSLLRILREVHLLESLQHHNIISYHHAWLETSTPANFVPAVPTLFVLMAFANGGSLLDFVNARGGGSTATEENGLSTEERKERARGKRKGRVTGRAVHLLRIEDILTLFGDIVVGLAFLHSRNILHLDLKAENVLLHWEEEALLPTCKLSDFGNATDDSYHREREGGSGTLEYTAPEAFECDKKTGKLASPDRSTDMWSLGLVLHLLCFFTLPYHHSDNNVRLEAEIRSYKGFFPNDARSLDHGTRHDIPQSLLKLMSKLINIDPSERPGCDRVMKMLAEVVKEVKLGWSDEKSEDQGLVQGSRASPSRSTSTTLQIVATQHRPLLPRKTSPPPRISSPSSAPSSHTITTKQPDRRSYENLLRSPVVQRKAFAGLASLVKLFALQLQSSTFQTASSTFFTYLVLIETILDVSTANIRTTSLLLVLHFALVTCWLAMTGLAEKFL